MPKRASIYLSDNALAALQAPEDGSLSGRINTVAIRYADIVADAMPTLSQAEWSVVCDCLNGTWALAEAGETDPARYVWAEVADSPELGPKWEVDIQALSNKLRALPFAGRCAVFEVAGRFWQNPGLNTLTTSELLAAAGAKLSEAKS